MQPPKICNSIHITNIEWPTIIYFYRNKHLVGEHKHFRTVLQEGRQLIYILQKSKAVRYEKSHENKSSMEAKDKGYNPCKPKKETAWSDDPLCLDQMLREGQNGSVHGK